MPDHSDVYKNQTQKYDRLISRQPSLLESIEEITPIDDLDIIDMGAGTGRLTTVLAPRAKSILALDSSAEMLKVNAEKLKTFGLHNWSTKVSDHRVIPAKDRSADLIVAGWAICYLGSSQVPDFKQNIAQIIQEMKRVLRPGGTIIIFETMGTGYETPHPPEFLKPYYSLLENEYGFHHTWRRLDYRFEDLQEAQALTRFFFGEELSMRVAEENLLRLPECAGIWWLTL